jgi:hypothetical protein
MTQDRDATRYFLDKTNIEDLKKVKDYLNKNPMASVMEVMQKTGVSSVQIKHYIDSGILKLKNKK